MDEDSVEADESKPNRLAYDWQAPPRFQPTLLQLGIMAFLGVLTFRVFFVRVVAIFLLRSYRRADYWSLDLCMACSIKGWSAIPILASRVGARGYVAGCFFRVVSILGGRWGILFYAHGGLRFSFG